MPETGYDVFSVCFGTACYPDELDGDLGTHWAIQDGYHKIFACCQYAHSMIEASLAMHARLGPQARHEIAAIEVETHPRGLTLTGVEPSTVLAAKFSMPRAAAVARLASGGQAAFSSAARVDPEIAALRHKVTLKPLEKLEPWPNDRAARVNWVMNEKRRTPSRGLPQRARRGGHLRRGNPDRQTFGKCRLGSARHRRAVGRIAEIIGP